MRNVFTPLDAQQVITTLSTDEMKLEASDLMVKFNKTKVQEEKEYILSRIGTLLVLNMTEEAARL